MDIDDATTVAACQLFSLACACEGEDVYAQKLKADGYEMGKRLGFYEPSSNRSIGIHDPSDLYRWKAHIAWGVYNWMRSVNEFTRLMKSRQPNVQKSACIPLPTIANRRATFSNNPWRQG